MSSKEILIKFRIYCKHGGSNAGRYPINKQTIVQSTDEHFDKVKDVSNCLITTTKERSLSTYVRNKHSFANSSFFIFHHSRNRQPYHFTILNLTLTHFNTIPYHQQFSTNLRGHNTNLTK